jgi:branched-chain amino acid transport system substrate-binding protein
MKGVKMKSRRKTMTVVLTSLMAIALVILSFGAIGCDGGEVTPPDGGTTPPDGGTTAPVVSEWVIPYITPLTGPAASFGLEAAWGVEFAESQINAAGGIRGVPVKLVPYDSEYDPAKTLEVMSMAVEDSLVVIGPMADITTDAAGPLAVDQGVALCADGSFLVKRDAYAPWMVSTYPDWIAAYNLGLDEWINLNPDIESVVLCYAPMATSHVLIVEGLEEECARLGIEVAGYAEVDLSQLDFNATAVKALGFDADGYYGPLNDVWFAPLIKAMYERGMTDGRRVCIGGATISASYLAMAEGEEFLEDTYAWNFYDMDHQGDLWEDYFAAYQAEHDGGIPYSVATGGFYENLWAIKTCFEELEITGDPAKLAEERLMIRDWFWNCQGIPGLQGDWGWTEGEKSSSLYMFQIHANIPELISQFR